MNYNTTKKDNKTKTYLKIIKIAKITIGVSFIVFLLVFTIMYAYFTNRWRNAFTDHQMKEFAKEVNRAPQLPNNFLFIYDRIYPKKRQTGLHSELLCNFVDLFILDIGHCYTSPYHRLYNSLLSRKQIENTQGKMGHQPFYSFAWGIKSYCSPEKAFDYYTNDYLSFLRTNERLSDYQRNLINRKIESLCWDELVEFILIFEDTIFSDKEKYPKRFLDKKKHYLKKIIQNE